VRPTASICLWTFTPRGLRLSRARWFRFSRSAGGSVEATKKKLSGNGLVSRARKECCPPVRGPLPPFCRNSRPDGKKFLRRLLPPTRLRWAKAEVFAQREALVLAVIQAAALQFGDHQADAVVRLSETAVIRCRACTAIVDLPLNGAGCRSRLRQRISENMC